MLLWHAFTSQQKCTTPSRSPGISLWFLTQCATQNLQHGQRSLAAKSKLIPTCDISYIRRSVGLSDNAFFKTVEQDRQRLLAIERLVLETVCFNFTVRMPFPYVIKMGKALGGLLLCFCTYFTITSYLCLCSE